MLTVVWRIRILKGLSTTSSAINRELLHQRWLHSYEEDTANEVFYRPASYNFPPSRGRTGFELRPDQTMTNVGIAATDISEETQGSWELENDNAPTVRIRLNTGETQQLPILAVEKDRLVVRK